MPALNIETDPIGYAIEAIKAGRDQVQTEVSDIEHSIKSVENCQFYSLCFCCVSFSWEASRAIDRLNDEKKLKYCNPAEISALNQLIGQLERLSRQHGASSSSSPLHGHNRSTALAPPALTETPAQATVRTLKTFLNTGLKDSLKKLSPIVEATLGAVAAEHKISLNDENVAQQPVITATIKR